MIKPEAQEYTITAHHMLPLFKVVSDLEDPKFTNRCLSFVAQETAKAREENRRYGLESGERERQSKLTDELDYSQPVKQGNLKGHNCKIKSKSLKTYAKYSPEKLNFAANFTRTDKVFDVTAPHGRIGLFTTMHKDIHSRRGSGDEEVHHFESGHPFEPRESLSNNFDSTKVNPSDNPVYEDPRDMVAPVKDKRKSKILSESPKKKLPKEGRSAMKEQKRKLVKKYESLIVGLMDRVDENTGLINEKQSLLVKMKEKLKLVHAYNKQFSEENDRLRKQQANAAKYIEECRHVIAGLEERLTELEAPTREPPEPESEQGPPEVVLVEVCMSCNTREIVVRQVKEHNSALQRDMTAMKDVIYRLNMQLSRYQEKMKALQSSADNLETPKDKETKEGVEPVKNDKDPINYSNVFETLNNANLEGIQPNLGTSADVEDSDVLKSPTVLNAQALAPLFEAYQQSIQEKDALILDYEKQFDNFNRRLKQVVADSKSLSERLAAAGEESSGAKEGLRRAALEREGWGAERALLAERTERAERKLKEVYELYEDKVAAMARDYETVHREYYTCKTALAIAEAKLAQLSSGNNRTVPADLHERRIDDCKRLFEELKYQYSVEREKRTDQLDKLRARNSEVEVSLKELNSENDRLKTEMKTALKNVRLYRRAAVIFRARLRASAASVSSLRRGRRRAKWTPAPAQTAYGEPLKAALEKVDRIKAEIQSVKAGAYRELAEVERRMRAQQAAAAAASAEHERDLDKMQLLVEHKERIIRNLIDKVADVEEVRLSEYNSHRLQGIIHRSPASAAGDTVKSRREGPRREGSVKLVPAPGGYFQEVSNRRS